MAKMSKKDLEDIISRDKPGFSIVERETPPAEADTADAQGAAEAGEGLDLDELRRRYLGDDAAAESVDVSGADARGEVAPDAVGDADDEIVVLTPDGAPADPWAPGPGRKSVIVSGKERRVIAEQG